jgi:hypothetical protein
VITGRRGPAVPRPPRVQLAKRLPAGRDPVPADQGSAAAASCRRPTGCELGRTPRAHSADQGQQVRLGVMSARYGVHWPGGSSVKARPERRSPGPGRPISRGYFAPHPSDLHGYPPPSAQRSRVPNAEVPGLTVDQADRRNPRPPDGRGLSPPPRVLRKRTVTSGAWHASNSPGRRVRTCHRRRRRDGMADGGTPFAHSDPASTPGPPNRPHLPQPPTGRPVPRPPRARRTAASG